ncbi:hypothetical protein M9H77_12456 [Catharanthus roseus]|uniref:Uncharacterized protein n=1 Tax=Catharanthus roseus TaxID=4058 RepID=A0ACC0BHI8_CATRO|nr:hypothetical protein M9H77_12456 [Catharanthus roseus]
MLKKKSKLNDASTHVLGEECSAILINKEKLHQKLEDPVSFSFPCTISSFSVDKALGDLGASINVMSYSMCKKLGLGKPRPVRMSINLADKSVKHPKWVIEDVLIKVKDFVFPVDFVILDMEEDIDFPIILGRPFLCTSRALIDMEKGKLILGVRENDIVFKFPLNPTPHFQSQDTLFYINHTTQEVSLPLQKTHPKQDDSLKKSKKKGRLSPLN